MPLNRTPFVTVPNQSPATTQLLSPTVGHENHDVTSQEGKAKMAKTRLTLALVLAAVAAMTFSGCAGPQPQQSADESKQRTDTESRTAPQRATLAQETLGRAERGDAEAQCEIGLMYGEGDGVAKDVDQAVKWITKSAEQGYAKAQFFLGVIYHEGLDVPQDQDRGIEWLSKASQQGNGPASLCLAAMKKGEGLQKQRARLRAYELGVLTEDQFRLDGWIRSAGPNVIGVAKVSGKGDAFFSCSLGYYDSGSPVLVCDLRFEDGVLESVNWHGDVK